MTDATKLKPCPFCGDMTLVKGKTTETKYLSCEGCGAEMHGCGPKAASHVVRKWNQRSDIAPKVKPLVFSKRDECLPDNAILAADCAFGRYYIADRGEYGFGWKRAGSYVFQSFLPTLGEAIEVAQLDYATRLLSALETQGEG